MSEPASDRVAVMVPPQLHRRLAKIQQAMRAETGRNVTLAEVIERAVDRAAMEEDQ